MADPTRIELLVRPSEGLAREYKGWVDIETNHGKAVLAKAAIALTNHGGGVIVMGMFNNADKTAMESQPLDPAFKRYTSDSVHAAISRYAEPDVLFDLEYLKHPETGIEHVIIDIAPSKVPVMSRSSEGTTIGQNRFYVRKPGPASEEPRTAEEWRTLINRCVLSEREAMLEAIRGILVGVGTPTERQDALDAFELAASQRWEDIVAPLPDGHPARLPQGHYIYSFRIEGVTQPPSRSALLRLIGELQGEQNYEWTPFRSTPPAVPTAVDDVLECSNLGAAAAAFSDFWRVRPDGLLFQKQGFVEDWHTEKVCHFHLDTQIRVLAEAIVFVGALATRLTGSDSRKVTTRIRFNGLAGRPLDSRLDSMLWLNIPGLQKVSHDDTAFQQASATARQMRENTAEIVLQLLQPVMERFGLFELRPEMIFKALERFRPSTR
ncbi:hypothetical protein [Mesorhizobium sp. M0013]|uniref:RNA-binding domain-containing protein n=1 Tax=Mesorhizobium sp. M0013 TaxID=2956841 RepID=UPI00333D4A62